MIGKIIEILVVLVVVLPAGRAAEHNPLLPRPQEIHYGAGELPLRGLSNCFASAPSSEDRFAAQELSHALSARAAG